MACVSNEQLAAEEALGLSDISRRGQRRPLRDMYLRLCWPGRRGHSEQNAKNSRKVIVDHVLAPPMLFACPRSCDTTDAPKLLEACRSQACGARWPYAL